MKKIYQNPTIKFVDMEAMNLLADTKIPIGDGYNGGLVLSRHNSIWDDEEDTEEDY